MIIAVGSTNEAKVFAVKEIVGSSPFFARVQVASIATNSDVSDQPLSLQETIQGAKNRAKSAFKKCEACSYSFGIESGLMKTSDVSTGFLHISVCCIYDGENYYTGLSTGFELPPQILELILTKKMDLGQACLYAGVSNNEKIGSTEGFIGVLTKGKVDRKEYSKQCITTAILQLENAEWYVRKQIDVSQ